MMRLLLLSNSTNSGENYLGWAKIHIKNFLGDIPQTAVFIPYAAVTFSYDEYEEKVNQVFAQMNCKVKSIHHSWDPVRAIEEADVIIIGGGNTWRLAQQMREHNLLEVIKKKVENGTPYIGWSAGSNVASPSIKTTNDMPIVDPRGFNALKLVPFQINPHFTDKHPEGQGGETREERIQEFIAVNPNTYVIGLREGCLLLRESNELKLIGSKTARIFKKDWPTKELSSKDDFSFLLENTIPQVPFC